MPYRNATSSFEGSASVGARTITKPTGLANNDYVLIFVGDNLTGNPTATITPSGFTQLHRQIDSALTTEVYGKLVTDAAGEGAWQIEYGTNSVKLGIIAVAYSGMDTTTPVHLSSIKDETGTTADHVTPTINITESNCELVTQAFVRNPGAGVTWTGTDTERVDGLGAGTNPVGGCLYDSNGTVATGSTSRTLTKTASTAVATMFIGALKQAAASGDAAGSGTPTDVRDTAAGSGASLAVPGPVTYLAGTAGDTQVVLTWSAPTPNGAVLTEAVGPTVGSSDPLQRSSQHHLALTAGGRILMVHGLHGQGLRLVYSDDDGATWETLTRGASTVGELLTGTGTGDWPASIVVSGDVAHVVWSKNSTNDNVAFVRLSDIDNVLGPNIGTTQTLETGISRLPDVAAITGGVVFSWWEETTAATTYNNVAGVITNLTVDNPTVTETVIVSASGTGRYGTLISDGAGGVAFAHRGASGNLRLHFRDSGTGAWTQAAVAGPVIVNTTPAGTYAGSRWHVAYDSNITGGSEAVSVQSWNAAGSSTTADLTLTGYMHPSLASDGTSVYLIARRVSDDRIVSRSWTSGGGWSSTDVIQMTKQGAGGHTYPNAERSLLDGKLRFAVRGPGASGAQSTIYYGESAFVTDYIVEYRVWTASPQLCGEPTIVLSGAQSQYRQVVPNSSVIDATAATWNSTAAGDYAVLFDPSETGNTDVCWHGGSIVGDYSNAMAWADIKQTSAIRTRAPGFTIERLAINNYGDAVGFSEGGSDWRIDRCRFTFIRDDAVENDYMYAGEVSDTLINGCYVAFSCRGHDGMPTPPDGLANLFVVSGCLVWLQPMPTVYSGSAPGHGGWFKWPTEALHGLAPKLSIHNTILRVDQPPNHGTLEFPTYVDPVTEAVEPYLVSSSNNTIVWLGSGGYPAGVPAGFTVTTDVSVWDNAVAAWTARSDTP